MDFSRLENSISDVIKEEQIKLGYRSETIRLYYPRESLNLLMKTDYDRRQMHIALVEFCKEIEPKFGSVNVTSEGERFCFELPPQAADYIHTHTESTGFLYDFIRVVSQSGISIDDVVAQFYKYSDCVHVEKIQQEDFDYLVYFEDGVPDEYRYCLTQEGHHIIYHRFTSEDYEQLFS